MMKGSRAFAALAFGLAAAAISPAQAGPNLVVNGDFALGDTGFYSAYYDVTGTGLASGYPATCCNAWNETTYAVGSNADAYHDLWYNVSAPSGAGNYLIANGNSNVGTAATIVSSPVPVWAQTVTVAPHTRYDFSAQATGVYPQSPADLYFYAGATLLGSLQLSGTVPDWLTFTTSWNSGSSSSVTLSIVDVSLAGPGNDFGVDNMRLAAPELPTWGMLRRPRVGWLARVAGSCRRLALAPAQPTPARSATSTKDCCVACRHTGSSGARRARYP